MNSKNTIHRIITTCFALLLLLSLGTNAYAAEFDNTITLKYVSLNSCTANLEITKTSSTGKASCNVVGYAKKLEYTVHITAELQKLNGTWSTIKSWSDSSTYCVELNKIHYVVSGYSYRIKAITQVYDQNDNLLETTTTYSRIVSY